jgi:hypothetical protein
MFDILFQPYPLSDSPKRDFIYSAVTGCFVAFFLIVFQPFGTDEWHDPSKNIYLMGFGMVTFVGSLIFYFVIKRLLLKSHFVESKWTVGREIIVTLCIVLFIGICNYLFVVIFLCRGFSLNSFLEMLYSTVLVGIFPTAITVIGNYIFQLKKYSNPPTQPVQSSPKNTDKQPIVFKLIAENEKDFIEVSQEELFYIESADNYSTIFFERNGQLFKELIRSSLTRLEGFIGSEQVVRCHRSYIVNLQKVASVSGNAQGYRFHLIANNWAVPVARKYSDIVTQNFK